jgi:hypothetical protein
MSGPGRTVAQGRAILSVYSRQSSGPSTVLSAGPSPGSFSTSLAGGGTGAVPSRKRSAPPSDVLTPLIGRPLAPKQPSTFGPETVPRASITGYQSISPMVDPSPRPNEPRKKRGRPTKQEAEERRRQMEERQQRRMQVQASQTTHPGPAGQQTGRFIPQFSPLAQSESTVSRSQLQEKPNQSTAVAPTIGCAPQTPLKHTTDEPNSSGSSGKRRKLRPPRLSGSDAEPLPPAFRFGAPGQESARHGSPIQRSVQHDGKEFRHAQLPTETTGYAPAESEISRFDTDEDSRAVNPRSRPWEVMERTGP